MAFREGELYHLQIELGEGAIRHFNGNLEDLAILAEKTILEISERQGRVRTDTSQVGKTLTKWVYDENHVGREVAPELLTPSEIVNVADLIRYQHGSLLPWFAAWVELATREQVGLS